MAAVRGATAQARQLRSQAQEQGWGEPRLVQEIRATCQVSLLAARRLARGWTLTQAAGALVELRGARGEAPQTAITVQMVNAWERGRVAPSWPSIKLLCALYSASPDQLGFGARYEHAAVESPPVAELSSAMLALGLRSSPPGPVLSDGTLAALAMVRARIGEHLGSERTVAAELDALDAGVERHAVGYSALPVMLPALAADAASINVLLALRLTHAQQRRAYRMLAQLAGLIGPNLYLSGQFQEGLGWLDTAHTLAVLADDCGMQAHTLAMRGRMILLAGDAPEAMRWVRRALATRSPGPAATLWAWDTYAQVLAAMGRSSEALAALSRTTAAYAKWAPQLSPGVFSFPERHLYRDIGAVHAFAGKTSESFAAISTARAMYPPGLFQSILNLDQVMGLIRDGELEHACTVATQTWNDIPPNQRAGVLKRKLAFQISLIPPRYQKLNCVSQLRDLIDAR